MEIIVEATGDVVERQELLNGTRSVTIEGGSADGRWRVQGTLSWNLGLVEYAGEGDITLSTDGGEIFGTVGAVEAHEAASSIGGLAGDDEGALELRAVYLIDGGAGEYDGTTGAGRAEVRLAGDTFTGRWSVDAV
jgi:hypothetical protein